MHQRRGNNHLRRSSLHFCGVVVAALLGVGLGLLTGCASLLWGAPQADFSFAPGFAYPHVSITFDASACASDKDEIVQYTWQFGDGLTGTGKVVSHTYVSLGYFTVTLTITTEHGQEASAQRSIHVADAIVVPVDHTTIQKAIDAASDGDTIVVLAGSYRENINFLGKAITVQSTDPSNATVVAATIIEGADNSDHSIVTFGNSETGASMLAGFTIRRRSLYQPFSGGAIYVREADPTIRNNHIVNNTTVFAGGGIYLVESRARISDNVFTSNESQSGGAITVDGYALVPTITGNTFSNNTAGEGGAIFIASTYLGSEPGGAAPLILSDNTFTGNVATLYGGGAVKVEYSGNLKLDAPDSNTYSGNDPDDIFYVVPP